MVLGAIVLTLVVGTGSRLQREFRGASGRLTGAAPLRDAAAILPLDLRPISSVGGDIRSGEARDTSLELRATVATGTVCQLQESALVLAPALGARDRPSAAVIEVGDTLWLLRDGEAGESWSPAPVTGVRRMAGGCGSFGASSGITGPFDAAHPFAVDLGGGMGADPSPVPVGTPARASRRVRYSFYRSTDGAWYLGLRTWNATAGHFNQIQPVSGPYVSPASGEVGFTYFDRAGAPVVSGEMDTKRIARVEIRLRTPAAATGPRADDSIHLVVALRNRK